MTFDVVTFGEAMLRLSPPNRERLESADQLDIRVGGAESNVAVALTLLPSWNRRYPRSSLLDSWDQCRHLALSPQCDQMVSLELPSV